MFSDFRRNSGFTVIEIILVVTIMGVFASMIAPRVQQSLKEWRVNRFSRAVLSAHQAARFEAISENRHIQVRYRIPEDEITFYHCTTLSDSGGCAEWSRHWRMSTIKPSNDSVDLWSVGDERAVDEACMYFDPTGQILNPVDRSGLSGQECESTGDNNIGSGVHITWKPNPDHEEESNHCNWNTIYVIPGSGSPTLLEYGAYPDDSGPFQHTMGSEPSCAS
ncbi:MAG: Tfp pilus assembly protein FimT/FimU [bacterium]